MSSGTNTNKYLGERLQGANHSIKEGPREFLHSLLPAFGEQTKMTAMSRGPLLENADPQVVEAFVQVVVLVAYADGDLSEKEEKILVDRITALSGGRIAHDHLRDLIVELPPLSRSSPNWRQERFRMLKCDLTDEALRKEAFALAIDVARSDDRIGLREGRMIINMMAELEIDANFAREVMQGPSQV